VNDWVAAIPFPEIDPTLFRVGWFSVRWYGIAYLLGFLMAYLMLRRMIRRRILRLNHTDLSDLMAWLVAGVLVGGRVGWWLFYHRSAGAVEPWYEPLAIWHGGMSFHGGLIGVLVALLVWSWRRRITFLHVADALALVVPVGLFFGRIANFVNGELVGRPTTLPWGVIFLGDVFARHPSQIYEAILEGPVLLLVLWRLHRTHPGVRDGGTAATFLILYGALRFAVEFARQPDDQLGFIAFGWLTMGQLLSVTLIILGLAWWSWSIASGTIVKRSRMAHEV